MLVDDQGGQQEAVHVVWERERDGNFMKGMTLEIRQNKSDCMKRLEMNSIISGDTPIDVECIQLKEFLTEGRNVNESGITNNSLTGIQR